MSEKELKALMRRALKEFSKGKAAAMAIMDELYAPDFIMHGSTESETLRGLKDAKQAMNEYYSAFPDLHYALDDIVVERNKAAVRCTVTGTHKGEFMGIAPTDKKIEVKELAIDRFVGGKIVEEWGISDMHNLILQLGVMPTPRKET